MIINYLSCWDRIPWWQSLFRTYIPRDTETVEVGDSQAPGRKSREKPRLVKHQELPTRYSVQYTLICTFDLNDGSWCYHVCHRCEGTASYQYTEAVAEKYRPKEGENVLERWKSDHLNFEKKPPSFLRLPEEGPMPQPAVGMRLSKWPDTFRCLFCHDAVSILMIQGHDVILKK